MHPDDHYEQRRRSRFFRPDIRQPVSRLFKALPNGNEIWANDGQYCQQPGACTHNRAYVVVDAAYTQQRRWECRACGTRFWEWDDDCAHVLATLMARRYGGRAEGNAWITDARTPYRGETTFKRRGRK